MHCRQTSLIFYRQHSKPSHWSKDSRFNTSQPFIFSSASSIHWSLGQQLSLDIRPFMRGIQPCTRHLRAHRACFHFTTPPTTITVEQKIGKIMSEYEGASQPLVLNCGRVGAAALRSHGHTHGLISASHWNTRKNPQMPPGGLVAYASLCLSVHPLLCFLKISVGLA